MTLLNTKTIGRTVYKIYELTDKTKIHFFSKYYEVRRFRQVGRRLSQNWTTVFKSTNIYLAKKKFTSYS